MKRKLLGKTTWYRGRRQNEKEQQGHGARPGNNNTRGTVVGGNMDMKTRAVIFVDQTPGGELAKQMREQIVKLEPILKYRLRVVERTGRNLLSNFPQTSTWSGLECGRLGHLYAK